MKIVGFAIAALICALLGTDVAGAEDLVRSGLEVRGGVLAHDVPDLRLRVKPPLRIDNK